MARINARQTSALNYIERHPDATTREVARNAGASVYASTTYDATHSVLARLEKRGMVERTGRAKYGTATWRITHEGTAFLRAAQAPEG